MRDFGLSEEMPVHPAPQAAPRSVPKAAPVSQSAPASVSGDTTVWTRLIEKYKAPLPANARAMLSMASGVVDGDCLTVLCRDDFTLRQLDKPAVLTVLRDVTKQELGRDIRVVLELGQAPASGKRTAPRTAPTPTPRPTPQEPPKPSAADTPPWESPSPPAASGRDKLDELLENGKQLDGFQIK